MTQKQLENMALELRRGVIALAVLSQLRQEQYGYSLIKLLNEQGLEIDQGTLYPLLRRLESSGLLKSEWRVEGPRPRRYYQTSGDGKEALATLGQEWNKLVEVMEGLLS
ncbi:MAG: PadR family transcriptional regulator [Anaerolineae bacterium SM23_ 63]|nr:MAG: PadR family transcriptional regulator [Anaerolineae bacterium SM23_ 63]HEY46352.1 PadR family transcriptional regulator [Anaerolineae bacterium]